MYPEIASCFSGNYSECLWLQAFVHFPDFVRQSYSNVMRLVYSPHLVHFNFFWQHFPSELIVELWMPVMMINNVVLFVGMPLIAEEVTAALYV